MSLKIICRCGQPLRVNPEATRYKCPKCLENYPVNQKTELEAKAIQKSAPKKSWTKALVIGAAIPTLILLMFGGYFAYSRLGSAASSAQQSDGLERRSEAQVSRVPDRISYSIIGERYESKGTPFARHWLDVEIGQKIGEEVMRDVAVEIKSKETEHYKSSYVFFYLPENSHLRPRPVWAIAKFDPAYNSDFIGLTVEEEATMRNWRIDPVGCEVSRWQIDDGIASEFLIIYQNNGHIRYVDLGGKYSSVRPHRMEVTETKANRDFKLQNSDAVYTLDGTSLKKLDPESNQVLDARRVD